uniref:dimethylaniline monooxygenase [N-oxide-forming] 2-like n=1 Tax=Styela clava TaxID=7725 RepID=UPI00193A5657|nr:dimethylaniline monooxygenase [N-oxide-forming] 2-like [Styela clava]
MSLLHMEKRVCIIGAGVSGISALKSCLEEGLEPVCYESQNHIGGLWNYKPCERDQDQKGARLYESLITNVSKEASCFSDFPYPQHYTPFFNHTKLFEYLKNYVAHFDLEKYITFNTKVTNVEEQESQKSAHTRRWKITTMNMNTLSEKVSEFDSIIVCVGANSRAKMPNIDGLSTFKGIVLHSREFDTPAPFKGKKVVVIGFGNSGADIAVDISRVADPAIISSPTGSWINPRVSQGGLPRDMVGRSRLGMFLKTFLPKSWRDWMARRRMNEGINHITLGIEPNEHNFSGKIIMKPGIVKIAEDSIHFSDGTTERADVIICCVGYSSYFPFISDDILPDDRSKLKLFEWMFPYELSDPSSLAVAGLLPGLIGSILPPVECQTRYIAQIMSGIRKLPSVGEMRKTFERQRRAFSGEGDSFVFRVTPGFSYQDRIAKLGGFYPAFWKLFIRSPRLAVAVYTSPYMSYHYRLLGRHQWKDAENRIVNAIPNTLFYAIAKKSD